MSKKLSPQEIRSEILLIFKNTQEFYSMKELEGICRAQGISQKNVKDVVQALVNENVIQNAKTGSISFYWIQPVADDENIKKHKCDELKARYKDLCDKLDEINSEASKKCKPVDESETVKREKLSKEIKELKQKEQELMDLKAKNAEKPTTSSNKSEMQQMQSNLKPLTDAVNRWTDNVFTSMEWTKKKLHLDDNKLLYKECKIPETLDYLN